MLGFRVWDIENKCMLDLEYDLINSDCPISMFFTSDLSVSPDYYIPMQSTGLKDYHGIEIYEGDVLLIRYRGTSHEQRMVVDGVVEFVQYECTCAEYSGVELLEIIGNIYENPELLEKTSC